MFKNTRTNTFSVTLQPKKRSEQYAWFTFMFTLDVQRVGVNAQLTCCFSAATYLHLLLNLQIKLVVQHFFTVPCPEQKILLFNVFNSVSSSVSKTEMT